MALVFPDGKVYEDETAYLLGVTEVAEPTSNTQVAAGPSLGIGNKYQKAIFESDVPDAPATVDDLKTLERGIGSEMHREDGNDFELGRGQRLEDERNYPGLGERRSMNNNGDVVTDETPMGLGTTAMMAKPNDPFTKPGREIGGGVAIERRRKDFDEFSNKNNLKLGEKEFRESLKVRQGQIQRDQTAFRKQFPDEAYGPAAELQAIRDYLKTIPK